MNRAFISRKKRCAQSEELLPDGAERESRPRGQRDSFTVVQYRPTSWMQSENALKDTCLRT
jgi:hypothetical protein